MKANRSNSDPPSPLGSLGPGPDPGGGASHPGVGGGTGAGFSVQRPRLGQLGLFGAITFAYSYVFFTGTVL